jgi:hypothetical protein
MPSLLRPNERVIQWPPVRPLLPDWYFVSAPRVLPGQFNAAMDPVITETGSGILVPNLRETNLVGGNQRAMRNMRADAATVLSLGPIPEKGHPQYDLAVTMHNEISPGDHVVLVPYLNREAEVRLPGSPGSGIPDLHIAGLDGDEWLDTTIGKIEGDTFLLFGNWIMLQIYCTLKPITASHRGKPRREPQDWGVVLAAGMDATVVPGQEIVVAGRQEIRPYDSKFFVSPSSPFGDEVIFFRESSWQVARNRRLEFVSRVAAVANA